MAMSLLGVEIPESASGSPHPAAIIPIALDGACLVSLGGFAAFHLCWGLVSDFVRLIDSVGSSRIQQAPSEGTAKNSFGPAPEVKNSSKSPPRSIEKRLAALEAKTAQLGAPTPPPVAKSAEVLLAEKSTEVELLRAKLAELKKPLGRGDIP
ncbi:hypothetical protein V7x_31590 [Crateriforma conspicua]|uniref:Uncharacterized protein n=1 Tax=Crateriforma conspicua TaxID=2527996 RepID=A0A5C6FZ17_9PLAN|nr:hypothetical protein [Crateriforma conspicua]TWU67584.1 hypothetical protein V7x_31590 [Crateriforma conspicua]